MHIILGGVDIEASTSQAFIKVSLACKARLIDMLAKKNTIIFASKSLIYLSILGNLRLA